MIEIWENIDIKLKTVIISASTSLTIFTVGWLIKIFHDRYSINYKLKREYVFEQQKNIQQEIAKTKIPLLNSAEAINNRLWNFINNIKENWHSIEEEKWLDEESYYLRSFVYRLLVFIYWVLDTEKSIISFDSTVVDKRDNDYLKFVKTFKHIFCDLLILEELGYKNSDTSNHFYINDLQKYAKYVKNDKGEVIDYDEFYEKIKENYSEIRELFLYIHEIKNNENNKNWNVLKCYHLLILEFLNNYGHDYQVTDKDKMNFIFDTYKTIKIKEGFRDFVERNKIAHKMRRVFKGINRT